jgi:TolA-binding protein
LEETNPPLSLQLAREAVARFPDSPNAPEFEWDVVKALTNLERFKEAQDEARIMVRKYPGTSWTNDIQRHVLSNPQE